jgi:hypothetical protein
MVNFAVRAPSATVTVAGTEATAGLELDSETDKPPVGAAAFKATVADTAFPPTTLVCAGVTDAGAGGFTVRVTGTATPLYLAVMVTGVAALTAVVAILNAGEVVVPAATLTDSGSDATAGLPLESFMVAPIEGAGANRVAVAESAGAAPPTTDVEERFSDATPSGFTVRVAVTLAPDKLAVMVTGVLAVT